MRDFYFLTILAAFYLLIILLCQASAQTTSAPPFTATGNGAQTPMQNRTNNIFSALTLDQLGITDPTTRQTLQDLYGTMLGDPECVKKSMCVAGNYFHNLPGRDLIFSFLSRYVPPEWGMLYEIFRLSIMYGQTCEIYICRAQPEGSVPPIPDFLGNLIPGGAGSLFSLPGLGSAMQNTTTASPPAINENAANMPGAATNANPITTTEAPAHIITDNAIRKDSAPIQNKPVF